MGGPLSLPIPELGKLLIPNLEQDLFQQRYNDNVGTFAEETILDIVHNGDEETYYILKGGMVMIETSRETEGLPPTFALHETAELTAWNDHIRSWANFARGHWQSEHPTEPGVYPVRNKHGARKPDQFRELVRVGEYGLRDVGGGFVRLGRVTEWVGDWWSVPIPHLPGAS